MLKVSWVFCHVTLARLLHQGRGVGPSKIGQGKVLSDG